MAKPGHVKALWVGSYRAELPGGKLLVPGETVVEIPAGEAAASDNWKPIKGGGDK